MKFGKRRNMLAASGWEQVFFAMGSVPKFRHTRIYSGSCAIFVSRTSARAKPSCHLRVHPTSRKWLTMIPLNEFYMAYSNPQKDRNQFTTISGLDCMVLSFWGLLYIYIRISTPSGNQTWLLNILYVNGWKLWFWWEESLKFGWCSIATFEDTRGNNHFYSINIPSHDNPYYFTDKIYIYQVISCEYIPETHRYQDIFQWYISDIRLGILDIIYNYIYHI